MIWFLVTLVCLMAAGILVIIEIVKSKRQKWAASTKEADDSAYERAAVYRRNQGACMPSPDRED
jgi:hypothetical protein